MIFVLRTHNTTLDLCNGLNVIPKVIMHMNPTNRSVVRSNPKSNPNSNPKSNLGEVKEKSKFHYVELGGFG